MVATQTTAQQSAAAEDEKRREPRERAHDGAVCIDGVGYTLVNWSSSGFLVRDYEGDHHVGDDVEVDVKVIGEEDSFTFCCRTIVVRVDKDNNLFAGVFIRVPRDVRLAISRHFSD